MKATSILIGFLVAISFTEAALILLGAPQSCPEPVQTSQTQTVCDNRGKHCE